MTIRPLHDRVVVRRTEAETTSRGGIIIPDSAAEKPNHGKYTSNEITVDGEELLILRESDILAVVEHTQSVEEAA